jgi:hypothetical protein
MSIEREGEREGEREWEGEREKERERESGESKEQSRHYLAIENLTCAMASRVELCLKAL